MVLILSINFDLKIRYSWNHFLDVFATFCPPSLTGRPAWPSTSSRQSTPSSHTGTTTRFWTFNHQPFLHYYWMSNIPMIGALLYNSIPEETFPAINIRQKHLCAPLSWLQFRSIIKIKEYDPEVKTDSKRMGSKRQKMRMQGGQAYKFDNSTFIYPFPILFRKKRVFVDP